MIIRKRRKKKLELKTTEKQSERERVNSQEWLLQTNKKKTCGFIVYTNWSRQKLVLFETEEDKKNNLKSVQLCEYNIPKE